MLQKQQYKTTTTDTNAEEDNKTDKELTPSDSHKASYARAENTQCTQPLQTQSLLRNARVHSPSRREK